MEKNIWESSLLRLCLMSFCIGISFISQTAKSAISEAYTISKLQNPYTNTITQAYEINDNGLIVGGYYLSEHRDAGGGIIWNRTEIEAVGSIGGAIYDHINNKGDVADTRNNIAFINSQPYFFDSMQIIDLNDNGILLLSSEYDTEYGERTSPSLFDGYTGEYLSRPGFNHNAYSYYGKSINNSNKTVGLSAYYDPPRQRYISYCPAVWDSSYSPDEAWKISNSYFIDINDNGIVLGIYYASDMKPFLWTEDDGVIVSFGSENKITYCYSLNNMNQVVGSISNKSFIWDPDDGLVYIDDLLSDNSGWSDLTTVDINNNGVIIGTGMFNGNLESFIMEPIPEPMTLSLLGLGGLWLRKRKC